MGHGGRYRRARIWGLPNKMESDNDVVVSLFVTRFYRCVGYVLVVLNLSVPKIIIS